MLFRSASFEDGGYGFGGDVALGEAHEVHGAPRRSSHGVNVREGVSGGDAAKGVGVVDNGREKVNGLDEGKGVRVTGNTHNGGIFVTV